LDKDIFVAGIFVSYTSSDRDWAFWIGQQLERFGHVPHIHEWEIDAGGNIPAWMQERQDKADHTLCIISNAYLSRPYSSWELQAAQWAAASDRPNFMLPVLVEDCKVPTMLAPFKRCDLFGLNEGEASTRLEAYLKPAAKPSESARFPGSAQVPHSEVAVFPGSQRKSSNTQTSSPSQPPRPDDAPKRTDNNPQRIDGEGSASASQTAKDAPLFQKDSVSRLILIGIFAILVLSVVVWLFFNLHSGTSVTAGDCGFANNGTASGNTVNCPPIAPAPKP
jgi:hypothetical protein